MYYFALLCLEKKLETVFRIILQYHLFHNDILYNSDLVNGLGLIVLRILLYV